MRRGELPPIAENCPKLDYCLEANQTLPCPISKVAIREYENRNPLSLSEQLCIRALETHSQRPCNDPYKDSCQKIDQALDYALALAPLDSPQETEKLVLSISDHLSEIYSGDFRVRGRHKYHAQARMIEAFLPAFRDRLNMEPVSHESALIVHANLCNILSDFDNTYLHTSPKPNRVDTDRIRAVKTELETIGLLTRLGAGPYFPFPAMTREESSSGRSEHNHDFYCINENYQKCPVQVKTSKNSGGYKGVIMINHRDIMRALRETHAPLERKTAEIPSISELILNEHRVGNFDKYSKNYLNLASVYVISRIDGFDDFRRD